MSRQYAPKYFLRMAPKPLLQQYLQKRGLGLKLKWGKFKQADIDLLLRILDEADEGTKREIELDFRAILAMADASGTRALIDEGMDPHKNVELADTFAGMHGHLERAFWAFLEHPKVFEVAERLHYAETLTRWRKMRDLPDVKAAEDDESADRLAQGISGHYRVKEGRGHACHVDHYRRGRKIYWFAYAEDYAVEQLVFESHELRTQVQRPAFEIVFIHDGDEHSLETWVKGDKQALQALQDIFGHFILGVDLSLGDPTKATYELDGLLDRNFDFRLYADDPVESVSVRKLRLRVVGAGNKRITLEASPSGGPHAVYDLLQNVLESPSIEPTLLQVTGATISLTFVEDGRTQTLPFDVARPDSCSLKTDPHDEVAKALLKRWGIDVSGSDQDNPGNRGPGWQRNMRV